MLADATKCLPEFQDGNLDQDRLTPAIGAAQSCPELQATRFPGKPIESQGTERLLIMDLLRWCSLSGLIRLTLAVGALALVPAAECRAGVLQFDFDQSRSLILATDGSVTYDQTSGAFNVQATGEFFLSNNLPNGNTQVPITNDTATINLTVDQNGNLMGTGSLTVTGAIDFDQDGTNDVSGQLVTGRISAFGAARAGPAPWEFNGLFNFTGGGLTQSSIPLSGGGTFTDLYKVGETGGFDLVIEQQVSGILGDFLAGFSGNTDKGITTGAVVPEPSTATLAVLALTTIAGWGALRHLLRGRIRPR